MENKNFGIFNNFTLKMIAIITMVIDHVGLIFFPTVPVFRAIGRIAFPIFCFLIVEGFYHTRSHLNYLIRLSIFAVLSEIPFDLAFQNTLFDWSHQNVFFTLALGLLAIFCLEEMNTNKKFAIPLLLTWAAADILHCDYGVWGVLLICIFYVTRETPWVRFVLFTLMLYVGYIYFDLLEHYALIAMLPITLYNGKRGPSTKMIFYWFYPLHLLVLYGLATYL